MKYIKKLTLSLFLALMVLSVNTEIIQAKSCSQQAGLWIGGGFNLEEYHYSFSLINLTDYDVFISPKFTDQQNLGGNFPYNTKFPSFNCNDTSPTLDNLALTTWRSGKHSKMFPSGCSTPVPISILDESNAYNFSLYFYQDPERPAQHAVNVAFGPFYGQTSWKYSQSVKNDNGFYADTPRVIDSAQLGEGIMYAISDKFILTLYGSGNNDIILVVNQKRSTNDYHGNHLQWKLIGG
ncbi:MAG TPA: hypothetical protein VN611_00585 [Patescibacteria group bacterium]|nr:hypothetical protein [Patescibacteria group bacterium]